jgi:hypothetical protein
LRKQHASLGNCRKDLTEIQVDEEAKTFVMKRSDPAGGSALLLFNFSAEAQSFPIARNYQPRRLLLWTGDQVYGGSSKHRPLETLGTDSTSKVSLGPFEAVIYVT